MNYLSWMMYAGDLVLSFAVMVGIIGIGGTVFLAGVILTSFIDNYEEDQERRQWAWKHVWKTVVFTFLWCFIPSQNTIYMIAASETTEAAMQTETGRKAVQALNRYLDSIGREEQH